MTARVLVRTAVAASALLICSAIANAQTPGSRSDSPAPGPGAAQPRGSPPNPNAATVPSTAAPSASTSAPAGSPSASDTNRPNSAGPPGQNTPAGSATQRSSNQNAAPNTGSSQQNAAPGASSSGPASASSAPIVNLSTQQKTEIRQTVINNHSAPRVASVNFNIGVGVVVPPAVQFAPVPATIVSIEPAWRGHYYFVYQEEIIIVDPHTRRIVAVLRV